MADPFTTALNLASSNAVSAAIIFGAGFLVAHLLHAIRYAFFRFGGMSQKIGYFVKYLLFLKVQ